ncbi:MAG: M81 family metallopeptidase, partial [Alphaproteobacteria bacterium]|nr:M81 family metallopeptidase [Alphaproteobacteria bacterium]
LHGNISRDMTDFSTCLYAYRKNPHSDARDAAVQAATMLDRLMAGERVSQHHLGTRFVIPPTGLGTAANPMKAVLARARAIEAEDRDILSINVMGGYAYADIADCGFSLNCCTRGDAEVANGYLRELAEVLEGHLGAAYPQEASLDTVLAQIDAGPEVAGPILLIEPADNIGGGTPGDGTGILAPLLASGRTNIVAIINDPQAAAQCHAAGKGADVSLEIGAKTDAHHGRPVAIRATVQHLSDGRFELENRRSHLASMMGTRIEMGPCAVIKNGQATILLTSRKIPPMDLGQLHSQGIEPEMARFVIIKAAVSHKDAYDPIAGASYYVDSTGLCTSNLGTLPYRKLTGKHLGAP